MKRGLNIEQSKESMKCVSAGADTTPFFFALQIPFLEHKYTKNDTYQNHKTKWHGSKF